MIAPLNLALTTTSSSPPKGGTEDASVSFEVVLNRSQSVQRASAFEARGVFGISGPLSARTGAEVPLEQESARSTALPASPAHVVNGVSKTGAEADPLAATTAIETADVKILIPSVLVGTAERVVSLLAALPGIVDVTRPSSEEDASSELQSMQRRQTQEKTAPKPFNLVLSGEGDSASVVLRCMDSTDLPVLRSKLAQAAAEFGVSLSDITINGAPLERPLTPGGSHGRRTR